MKTGNGACTMHNAHFYHRKKTKVIIYVNISSHLTSTATKYLSKYNLSIQFRVDVFRHSQKEQHTFLYKYIYS